MLYRLFHVNVHSKNGRPYETCIKTLGYYSTAENAINARERYKIKKGFSNYVRGFGIEALCKEDDKVAENPIIGYAIGYSDLSEDSDELIEFFVGGYYSDYNAAKQDLDIIRRTKYFNGSRDNLNVLEFVVDEDASWPEGFKTI